MTAVLHIRLFGGLTISQGDTPLSGFVSHKVPALLAYLAVTGRPHQRDTLAALLWGEMAEADAKNNLRQALTNLRKLVDPHLIINRDSVAFNTAVPHTLDVAQFETQLQHGRTQPDHRFEHLAQAAALYQGDFLAGFLVRDAPDFEEWLLAQRTRYRELAIHTLHSLTQYHLERGEYGRAIDQATRLLALDAWREESHRQLMLAQLRSGQRSAALAQYETCRRLLDQELGVSPSPETTALYQRIRDARHRVHLPPATTPFVGRVGELAQIARLLADPTCHIITLSGPGGSGKTRLALEAAARTADTFLHGVCFVPLAAVNTLDLLPSTIAEALAVALSGKAEPQDQLLTYLRDKELLLLLDNLEHLHAAEWLGRLIEACPDVRLLVTSRERLNLHGERLFELNGLDVPSGKQDEELTGFSAAQLFLGRAREAMPAFSLNAQNETAVTHICQLVHGLPLAIELAAAWVRHLTCQEIAGEIEQNLDFLATSQKNVPARHRSLQAAFEHSWALLSAEERLAFARLSLFRGGCTREAATAVSQTHQPILAALCDKSLLHRDPDGRYTMHELLRQYAQNKLQANPQANPQELAETQARHCQTYIRFLAEREDALNDARQNETRREITAEIDNIRAAWAWAIAGQQPHLLEPALESLRLFLEYAGWYSEAIRLFTAAAEVERINHGDSTSLFGKLLLRQAWFYHRQDRFELARPLVEQSLAILNTANPAEAALCWQCRANMARAVGDFPQSIAYAQQSLTLYRMAGNPGQIAFALNTLAVGYAEQGDFAEAQRLHTECLALRRELKDRRGVATTLVNLAFQALGQAQYAEVKSLAQEALDIFREIGYPMGEVVALNNLGAACYMLAEYNEAREWLEVCLAICRELGHRHIAAHALGTLGGVAGALGNYAGAWRHTREGLQMAQDIGSVSAMLFGLLSTAVLLFRQGEYEQAAQVAALVYHHASTNRETKDRAGSLLEQLAARLPAPLLAAAQARGQAKKLEEVAAEILARPS